MIPSRHRDPLGPRHVIRVWQPLLPCLAARSSPSRGLAAAPPVRVKEPGPAGRPLGASACPAHMNKLNP